MSTNNARESEEKSVHPHWEGSYWRIVVGVLFVTAFVAVLVELVMSPGDKAAFVAGLAVMGGALIVVSILPALTRPGSELSFGPQGLRAKVGEIEKAVNETKETIRKQGEQLADQQDVINSLVKYSLSASIFRHLCGIACLKEYKLEFKDNDTNRREMYFLRDAGYIMPKSRPYLDFDASLDGQNLVDVAEPTPIGRYCVWLRRADASWVRQGGDNLRARPEDLYHPGDLTG